MKLVVLTKEEDNDRRETDRIVSEVEKEGFEVERIDWDSEEAVSLARLYDIYSTPAFIVIQDDGKQVEQWQGDRLPLASEIKHLM